jgi:hypothetical protein
VILDPSFPLSWGWFTFDGSLSIVGVQLQCKHFSVAFGVLLRGQGATLVSRRTVSLNSCQHFDLPVRLVVALNSPFDLGPF